MHKDCSYLDLGSHLISNYLLYHEVTTARRPSWSQYISVGLFTCPRFGEKELITRTFKVENSSFQAPYFSEIQHVGKMRFKNLDGEVRHLWGPAGMCRLPSAECTLPRAVHRAWCTQAGTHFSSTYSSAFTLFSNRAQFSGRKKACLYVQVAFAENLFSCCMPRC